MTDTPKPQLYRYAWGPRMMGFNRKGEICEVLVRGKMNSCLVKFADGFTAVVSRNALRRKNAELRLDRRKKGGE